MIYGIYKVVATLKNGSHEIIRLMSDDLAHFVSGFNRSKEYDVINAWSKYESVRILKSNGELFLAL